MINDQKNKLTLRGWVLILSLDLSLLLPKILSLYWLIFGW